MRIWINYVTNYICKLETIALDMSPDDLVCDVKQEIASRFKVSSCLL